MMTEIPPRKIFVTALPRTGTSSLEHALRGLGYRTVHFPHTLFDNMQDEVLVHNDAFTDLPIPLLYQELDQLHPGARFIHVSRDLSSWLDSMEWLFSSGEINTNGIDGMVLSSGCTRHFMGAEHLIAQSSKDFTSVTSRTCETIFPVGGMIFWPLS